MLRATPFVTAIILWQACLPVGLASNFHEHWSTLFSLADLESASRKALRRSLGELPSPQNITAEALVHILGSAAVAEWLAVTKEDIEKKPKKYDEQIKTKLASIKTLGEFADTFVPTAGRNRQEILELLFGKHPRRSQDTYRAHMLFRVKFRDLMLVRAQQFPNPQKAATQFYVSAIKAFCKRVPLNDRRVISVSMPKLLYSHLGEEGLKRIRAGFLEEGTYTLNYCLG